MEIDTPVTNRPTTDEDAEEMENASNRIVKIHPLAIVGMSDHHTRVKSGGSAMSATSEVIGLLFGQRRQNAAEAPSSCVILDSEEVEGFVGGSESILSSKIELHQRVFPTHQVVGWYRVVAPSSSESEDEILVPTAADLQTSIGPVAQLAQDNFIFLLMSAAHDPTTATSRPSSDAKDNNNNNNNNNNSADDTVMKDISQTSGDDEDGDAPSSALTKKMETKTQSAAAAATLDRDNRLPISVHEILSITKQQQTSGDDHDDDASPTKMAFVNIDFELETSESERIAVERVFKSRPGGAATTTTSSSSSSSRNDEESNKNAPESVGGELEDATDESSNARRRHHYHLPPPSPLELHLQSIRSSVESMNARISILMDHLRKLQDKKTQDGGCLLTSQDYALLRQMNGLIGQLPSNIVSSAVSLGSNKKEEHPFLSAHMEYRNESEDVAMLSTLATIAQTTAAVQLYADKFRLIQDHTERNNRRAY